MSNEDRLPSNYEVVASQATESKPLSSMGNSSQGLLNIAARFGETHGITPEMARRGLTMRTGVIAEMVVEECFESKPQFAQGSTPSDPTGGSNEFYLRRQGR